LTFNTVHLDRSGEISPLILENKDFSNRPLGSVEMTG